MNTATAVATLSAASVLANGEARRNLLALAEDPNLDPTDHRYAHGAAVALRMASYQQTDPTIATTLVTAAARFAI